MADMIDRAAAAKAMADYHWTRYASRAEGGELSSPAVFTSHTWQDVQDIIAALPPAPDAVEALVKAGGVYIASKTVHGPRWQELRAEGYPIVSTWIDESGAGATSNWADLWRRCVSEAASASILVAYREPGETLKGAWVEVGAALAAGKAVVLCGDFSEFSVKHHPNVIVRPDGDVRAALRALGGAE